MKYLIVSDIHGREEYIHKLMNIINIENPNKVIILGDIMSSYNNDLLLTFLYTYKDLLILIEGNCDIPSLIPYKMFKSYTNLINDKLFIFTHGHLSQYMDDDSADVIVSGHTHQHKFERKLNGVILFNPGSISLPRGNTVNSYGLITDTELIIKDLDSNTIDKINYM